MRGLLLLLVVLSALGAAIPGAAHHTLDDEVRCDGGFCQSGEDHLVDCREGTCTGSASGFPTIVNPSYAEDNPRLADDERVLGTEIGGQALAYPIEVLRWFETVQDEVEGTPVLVTYCPLCGSGVVFERRLANETVTLYNSGEIWRNDLVLYETETKSRFSQVLGEGIQGPLHGEALPLVGATITSWASWREGHPDTLVLNHPLDRDGNPMADYEANPYEGYRYSDDTPQGHRVDDETDLHPKARVAGVKVDGETLALPEPAVEEASPVEATVGGTEVVAAWYRDTIHVYETGGRDFSPGPTNATILDGDGNQWWVANGTGPDGQRLQRAPSESLYWFAWLDIHPDTRVLTPRGQAVQAEPTSNTSGSPVPGPGVGALAGLAALAALVHARGAKA